MQSTSPPPPPPYASKHTIIAAPPAVSNRSPLFPTTGKVLSPDPNSPGHRVSTALNITFSSPPPTEANRRDVFIGDSNIRRYTVQRVMNQLPLSSPQLNSGGSSSSSSGFNSATSGSNPPADWKHGICAECGGRITNVATACQALGCFYHDKCFVCCCCQRTLRGKTFYKDQDKIYCEEDYLYCGFQRMAEKCTVCGHIIAQTILQAMGKSYHPGCFRCTVCNMCLDGDAFTVDPEGRIFCLYDFYLATAPTCAACANPILPDSPADEVLRVVAMNKEFHIECYRCEDCNLLLSDEVSSRCYPYIETSNSELPGRTHLLCLKCHLARIGATPAPGQNLDILLQQRGVGTGPQHRGSNGSSSLTSSTLSCDIGPCSSGAPSAPTFGSKPLLTSTGDRSSPFSTEPRRGISRPWLHGRPAGYYGEGDGR